MHPLLEEIRNDVGEKLWKEVLQGSMLYATIGDYVWGLLIVSIYNSKHDLDRKEKESWHQALTTGDFQRAVATKLGLHELIGVNGGRRLSETFEALLGAWWWNTKELPLDWCKDVILEMNPAELEEFLDARLHPMERVHILYPGSKWEFARDSKGQTVAKLVSRDGKVIVQETRTKRSLAQQRAAQEAAKLYKRSKK